MFCELFVAFKSTAPEPKSSLLGFDFTFLLFGMDKQAFFCYKSFSLIAKSLINVKTSIWIQDGTIRKRIRGSTQFFYT